MTTTQNVVQLILYVAFFALVVAVWTNARQRNKPMVPVPDGPPNELYRVYSREFDCELAGRALDQKLIPASPDYVSGWLKLGKGLWRNEVAAADRLVSEQRSIFHNALGDATRFDGQAVTLLVDQSGSMRDEPIRCAAVACYLAAEMLPQRGCDVEILGFSTVGWRGGFAYEKWKANGRPKRPGRLCALLHVIYKPFAQALDRADWEAMLNPNALRENIDGEALEWASQRLRQSKANKRHLIVLSDGAPVDDATLLHNGLNYLSRHLREVISNLEAARDISLSAIGIRYEVSEYYHRSTSIEDLAQLPRVTAEWLRSVMQDSDS
jgi:cobaltochelatase CobT